MRMDNCCSWTLGLLLALCVSVKAAGQCKPGCHSDGDLLKYQPGHNYEYHVTSTAKTNMNGAEDSEKLDVSATAILTAAGECNYVLRLKDVKVNSRGKPHGNLKELEEHPILFNMGSHVTNGEICTSPKDEADNLNIKRAIVSMLQTSKVGPSGSITKVETDVYGICPTQITSDVKGDTTHIKKERNLLQCSHREGLRQDFFTVRRSSGGSIPLLLSDWTHEQTITKHIIQEATTEETYSYRPLSNEAIGAESHIITKIKLVNEGPSAGGDEKADQCKKVQSLIFDAPTHTHRGGKEPKTADIITAIEACGKDSVGSSVSPREARNFRKLVNVIRDSKTEEILAAYQQAKSGAGFSNKKYAKKVLLDALAHSLTSGSLQVTYELLKSNELPIESVKILGPSWGFSRNPCPGSLESATHMLDLPNFPREGVLGIGALAGRYCQINGCEGPQAKLDALVGKLSKSVKCKANTWEDENKQLVALKALENIGHLSNNVVNQLSGCLNNPETTNRVKSAILQTLASDACNGKARDSALKILQDIKIDSELRIRAYHVVVKCPNAAAVTALKTIYEKEPSYQVGGYIQSHLRNLRASANVEKQKIQKQLGDIRAHKKYPVDAKRFSSNYELSSLMEMIGLGSTSEADIIYSQRSFLPRSVTLNVSSELFGHAVNLIELEARAENWERPLEALLGPKGELKTHDKQQLIKDNKKKADKIRTHLEDRWNQILGRPKRSAAHPKIQQSDAPQLDLSLKVLGNEIAYITSKGDRRDFGGIGLIDKFFDKVEEGMDKAKKVDLHNSIHTTFLESEIVYPTSMGLSIILGVQGTAAVHLHLDGKADIKSLIKNPETGHVSLEIQPSADIELVGALSIDALAVESGVQVGAHLHSSSGVQLEAKGVQGSGIDITVGLPLPKQKILSLNTEFNYVHREVDQLEELKPIKFSTKQNTYKGCFDQLAFVSGLTVCGSLSFPSHPQQKSAYSVFQGPVSLEVIFDAEDVKTYNLRSVLQGNNEHKKLQLLFDTPNSKTNRKLELIAELKNSASEKGISVHLTSPWKEGLVSATILDDDKESSIGGQVKFDPFEYIAKVGVEKEGSGDHIRYTPLLEYKTPSTEKLIARKAGKGKPAKIGQGYSIDGAVIVDKNGEGKKYTFDNVMILTPDNKKYSLIGWLAKEPNVYSSDLKASYGDGQYYHLRGSVDHNQNNRQLKVNSEFTSTEYPDIGVSLKLEHSCSKEHIENNLVIVHGKDLASTQSRISFYQQGKWRLKNTEDFDLSGSLRASYPVLGIDLKLHGGLKPNEISGELSAAYDNKKVSAELSGRRPKLGDWDIDAKGQFLENSLVLQSHRKQSETGKSKLTNKLTLTPGGTYELNADCEHDSSKDSLHLASIVTLIAPNNKVELDSGVTVNPHGSNVHLKLIKDKVKLIDVDSKIVQGSNQHSNGNIKALFKDHLVGSVEWTSNGQKATGALELDCKHFNRKINGNGEISWNKYYLNGKGDLFWDKDTSKSLHLETDTKWEDQLETNSAISLNGKKVSLVGKLSVDGKLTDGIIKGQGELECPEGHKITVNLNRELRLKEGDIKVKVDLDVTVSRKDQPHKLIVKIDSERLEHLSRHYSLVEYKCPHGNDWSVEAQGKASCNKEESWHVDGKLNVKGPNDLQPNLDFSVDKTKGSLKYKVEGKLAADTTLDASGSCLHSQNKWDMTNDLTLHLPTGELKLLKLNEKTIIEHHDDHCKVNGNYVLQWNGNAQAELNLKGQREKNHVEFEVDTQLPKQPKRIVKGEWKQINDVTNDVKLEVQLDENKITKLNSQIIIPQNKKHGSIKIVLETPAEKYKKNEFYLGHKKSEQGYDSWVISVASDNTHASMSIGLDIKPNSKIIDINTEVPSGKSRIYLNCQKKAPNNYETEVKLLWPHNGGGSFDMTSNSRIDSPQDFQIVTDIESPKLGLVKYHSVLANKAAKGGKALLITVNNDGQSIISGKLDYRYKIDGADYKYEADGQLKVRGEPRKAHFVVEYKTLNQEKNHEVGSSFSYKVQLGEADFEISYKITNRHLNAVYRYCKTKESCQLAIGNWELHSSDISKYHSEGSLKANIKELNIDLNAKTSTKTDGWTYDHKITAKTGNGQEYSFHSALTTKDAIAILTFGQRIIAAETRWNMDKIDSGHQMMVGADIWLDKGRQPNVKAGLIAKSEFSFKDGTAFVSGLTKVTHPAIGKELEIKGNGKLSKDSGIEGQIDLDIFSNKNQKIEIKIQSQKQSVEKGIKINSMININSKGQNLDIMINTHTLTSYTQIGSGIIVEFKLGNIQRGASAGYEINPEQIIAYVKTPRHEILNLEVKLLKEKRTLISKLQVLDGHKYEMKNQLVPGKLITSIKQENNLEFDSEASIDFNKGASVVGVVKGTLNGKPVDQELFKVTINWAEDSVKPEYNWNIDLAKELVEGLKDKVQKTGEKLQTLSGKISEEAQKDYNEVTSELANYNINFHPVIKSYQEQIDAIGNELLQDKLIKEICDSLSHIMKQITEMSHILSKTLLTGVDSLIDYLNQLKTLAIQTSQKVSPHVGKALKNVLAILVRTTQSVLATLLQELANFLEFVKQYDTELKQIITAVGELVRDLSRIFAQFSHQILVEVKEFTKVLHDQIKALSLPELIQERIEWAKEIVHEVIIPEEILKFILEIINSFNQELPTPELKDLSETITTYLENRIQKKPVDDIETLRLIVSKIGPAIRSVIDLVQLDKSMVKSPINVIEFFRATSVKLAPLIKIPSLLVHFSPINWLRSDDLPSLLLLLKSQRPETLSVLDWEPPFTAHAILVDGEHFITWDRKHFTFKGSCEYVLARDELDGNFTITVTLDNGKFKSVKLSDPQNSIEMAADETLKLGGQPVEYPVHHGDLHAWKKYHTSHLLSNYGVSISYNPANQVLLFSVNGFYFGRLRGLLGNLNYERFDDALVPNGVLPDQIAKFANAWKVDGGCADGTAIEHSHHHEDASACKKVFGSASALQVCYPFVSYEPFKEACNHAVASATPEEAQKNACNIGAAYITACLQENPLSIVQLPSICGHCTVGSHPLDVGHSVAVESPNGLADIIFVIEETQPNAEIYKELVVPLMTTLTAELKTKGINDIHYSLTGFKPSQKWPSQHTNGDKLIFQGSANGINFDEPAEQKPSQEFPKDASTIDKLKWLKYQFDIEISNNANHDSLTSTYSYPHRAGAAKAVIFIPTSACTKSILWPFSLQKVGHLLHSWYNVLNGQFLFVITPIDGFDIEGNTKQAKNVVGFDSHTVYLNSDAKKKTLDGQPDLRPKLKTDDKDSCIDYAQSVNGAVFNANNFLEAKPPGRKQFIQVTARRVVQSLSRETYQQCYCGLEKGLFPTTECYITQIKSEPQSEALKVKSHKG